MKMVSIRMSAMAAMTPMVITAICQPFSPPPPPPPLLPASEAFTNYDDASVEQRREELLQDYCDYTHWM